MPVYVFRCRQCGRVAPQNEWTKVEGTPGMGRGGMIAFPNPKCPQCGSKNVDMNYDYKET